MKKLFFLIVILLSALESQSVSSNIDCNYNLESRYEGTSGHAIYQCSVNNILNISVEESAKINGVSGTHVGSRNNNDVIGFRAGTKIINFFPKGLEKFFINLKVINIWDCQLKEIHQSDLKVFPNLTILYLSFNKIEVIEEGLFDFNPNLEVILFYDENIIHIDSNVFDHLNKLSYFFFLYVPCVKQDVKDSREKVLGLIKVVKSKCSNSDFLSLENQIKNLEIESKSLNSEEFIIKLERFEKSFSNSKFSKFRPLNYKFQNLKLSFGCLNCIKLIENQNSSALKAINVTLNNDTFEELKNSQCGLERPIDELNATLNEFTINLLDLKLSVNNQKSKLDQIQNFQNQLKDSMSSSISTVLHKVNDVISSTSQIEVKVNDLKSSQTSSMNDLGSKISKLDNAQMNHGTVPSDVQNLKIDELSMSKNYTILAIRDFKLSQDSLKASQDSSLSNLTLKLNELENDIKSTHDDTKLSISDILAMLSDHKRFQNDVKDSLIKIRTSQNDVKVAINVNFEDKFEGFVEKLGNVESKYSDLNDKVESLNGHFVDFKAENSDKLAQIEKELTKKFHKMTTNFDEKIKGIEKRLMKRFEEILEEKLKK